MPDARLLLRLAVVAVTSRSTRLFYDRVSPIYESLFTSHLSHTRKMAEVLSEELRGRTSNQILDVACGTGILSRGLEERGFRITGLDFSFQSLLRVNRSSCTIRLTQADAAALPFGSASFDVVTCMGAWRHFPDHQRVLNEVRRVLRPDGVFFIGYFPPKLGGLLSIPKGALGKVFVSFYRRIMRLLKYSDTADQELERQTVKMIELAFAKYRLIQSGESEYLIFARWPRSVCVVAS